MWRPEGWQPDPCKDCSRKIDDVYGRLCDISCGEHTRYENREVGADEMHKADIEWLMKINRAGGSYYHNGQWWKTFEFQVSHKEWQEFIGE